MLSNVDTGPLLALIGAMVLFVGPRVKQFIDIIGLATTLPKWAPPTLAFTIGVFACVGFAMAMKMPFDAAIVVACIFSGIQVAADAMGITELQNHRNDAVAARKRGRES